jgi:hypothetical protein
MADKGVKQKNRIEAATERNVKTRVGGQVPD